MMDHTSDNPPVVGEIDEKKDAFDVEDGSRSPSDSEEEKVLAAMGFKQELQRNRSMFTLLFQSLAIAAIPYGEGAPLIYAIYGGGQRSIFAGWIMVCIVGQAVALSLAELTSKYPTTAGPPYYAFRLAPEKHSLVFAYITGWIWVIGNWTILLSVNFGFASILAGAVSMYHPDFIMNDWQLLLVFFAITLATFVICTFFNRYLPHVDTVCAAFTATAILVICIALSVSAKAGRNSVSVALGQYDTSLSGWGGFSFFIGLLPAAYTFVAPGMMTSMAEECARPTIKLPTAMSLTIPVGGIAGLFFILPICFTMPALSDIAAAPNQQALPYIFLEVMGSPGGGLALIFFVLCVTIFCSISVTVAVSRCTWAFARDKALPGGQLWGTMNKRLGVPVWSLVFITVLQLLLGLIRLGSTAAFTAFVSVGVQGLSLAYGIPIALSLFTGRREVNKADWRLPNWIGMMVNVVALLWIGFQLVLFSMPGTLPVTPSTMNYAVVLLVGFIAIAASWYMVYARKHYNGPPAVAGL